MRRQRIIETVTCDKCGNDTDEPSSWVVEIGQPRSPGQPIKRTVDLCPADTPVVAQLREWLRTVGRAAEPTAKAVPLPDIAGCPICDAQIPVQYMGAHLVRKHGASATQPPRCPDCDTAPHKDASSLIVHRTRAHGYDHRAALLASITTPSPKRKRSR